jgi:hypothetical protein
VEWEVGDVLWNTEQKPPALVRTVQANERTLAANNRLKGHPPLQYMEPSIELKEENWFLRMCHYFVNTFILTVYTRVYFGFVYVLLREFQDNFDVLSVVISADLFWNVLP